VDVSMVEAALASHQGGADRSSDDAGGDLRAHDDDRDVLPMRRAADAALQNNAVIVQVRCRELSVCTAWLCGCVAAWLRGCVAVSLQCIVKRVLRGDCCSCETTSSRSRIRRMAPHTRMLRSGGCFSSATCHPAAPLPTSFSSFWTSIGGTVE
jgi:hypothetical protein